MLTITELLVNKAFIKDLLHARHCHTRTSVMMLNVGRVIAKVFFFFNMTKPH